MKNLQLTSYTVERVNASLLRLRKNNESTVIHFIYSLDWAWGHPGILGVSMRVFFDNINI